MTSRAQYIEIVRNLYSLSAAVLQDDRDGFVTLAEDIEDLSLYATAGIVAMRPSIVATLRREQTSLSSLLSENGPLSTVPPIIRNSLARLHRGEVFDGNVILQHLSKSVSSERLSLESENIIILGTIVDAVISAWELEIDNLELITHARHLLLITEMIER